MSKERFGEWQEWPFDPLRILRTLVQREVGFVVVGGVAAVLRGAPTPTYSLDIVPAPDGANRKRLLAALADLDAMTLTDVADTGASLGSEQRVTFYTPCGHLDVYRDPAGFSGYTDLRRSSGLIELDAETSVRGLSLRGLLRSKLANGDTRHASALEATLERRSARGPAGLVDRADPGAARGRRL